MDKEEYKDFVLDQLSACRDIVCRPMFGGFGLYAKDKFFGIILKNKLYFKTNELTRGEFVKWKMKPFKPNARQTLKNYYQVPEEIIDRRQDLESWAIRSVGS